MEETKYNSAPKWKNILCLTMLVLYCTALINITVSKVLSYAFNAMEGVVVAIMLPQLWQEFKKIGKRPKILLYILLGIVMLFGLQVMLWDNILLPVLKSITGLSPSNGNNDYMFGLIEKYPLLIGTLSCLFGPVLEELLYRYTLFGLLYEKNRFAAYSVTALLFGFQHVVVAGVWGGDATQFLNIGGYMIFSLIMCFLYSKSKSLGIPVIVHILYNTLGVTVMLMGSK